MAREFAPRFWTVLAVLAVMVSCSNDSFDTECIVCDSVTVCQDYYERVYNGQSDSIPEEDKLLPWADYKQFCYSKEQARLDSLMNKSESEL